MSTLRVRDPIGARARDVRELGGRRAPREIASWQLPQYGSSTLRQVSDPGPRGEAPAARLLVASIDDHDIVPLALESALIRSTTLRLCGSATTVDEFLESGLECQLVLLDLRLADGSSPRSNVQRLMDAGYTVIAFTSGESPYLTRLAIQAGVAGVLRKSEPIATVIAALENAAAGHLVITSEWAHAVESDPQLADARLSEQETRILTMFADGAKAQAVASRLGITVGTLEDYVRRIRVKYARVGRPAYTKVDLYKRAVEDGLLPGPTQS